MTRRPSAEAWLSRARLPLQSLVVAISPGLVRLIVVAIIGAGAGLDVLGQVGNDVALVQILGYVTGVGWASLALVRAAAPSGPGPQRLLRGALLSSLIGWGLVLLGATFGVVIRPVWCAALLMAWSLQLVARNHLIGLGRLPLLILLDVVGLMAALVLLLVVQAPWTAWGAFLAIFTPAGTYGVVLLALGSGTGSVRDDVGVSVRLGFSHAASNTPMQLPAPLAVQWESAAAGGVVTLAASLAQGILLLVRAVTFLHVPRLSEERTEPRLHLGRMGLFRRDTWLIGLLASFGVAALWAGMARGCVFDVCRGHVSHWGYWVVLVYGAATFGIADTAYLTFREEASTILTIYGSSVLVLLGAVGLMILWNPADLWMVAMSLVAVTAIVRGFWLRRVANRALAFAVRASSDATPPASGV